MKRVYNNKIERLIRTLSFVLIAVSSIVVGLGYALSLDWQLLTNIVNPIKNFINEYLTFLNDYAYLFILIGIIGLIFTQAKTWFSKIFVTSLVLVVVLIQDQYSVPVILKFLPSIGFIKNLLNDPVANNNWLLLVIQLVGLLSVYLVFNARKPRRLSLSLTTSAIGFVMLGLVFKSLPVFMNNDWLTKSWYILVINIDFFAAYTFLAIGSILGIIGFFRK